ILPTFIGSMTAFSRSSRALRESQLVPRRSNSTQDRVPAAPLVSFHRDDPRESNVFTWPIIATVFAVLLLLGVVVWALTRIVSALDAIGGAGGSLRPRLRRGWRAIERAASHLAAPAP